MTRPLLRALRALAAIALPFASSAQQAAGTDAWSQFAKLPAARQQAAVNGLVEGLPEAPLAKALRGLAAAADQVQHERTKPHGSHRAKRTIEFPLDPVVLPSRVDYLFGVGTIVPHAGKAPAPGHPDATDTGQAADPTLLHQALLGITPDADKALALLLQRLDSDAGGDGFAAFLQSWRNGDESFYEALDRTAGTKDSVFFFDVMIDDFRGQFGGGHGETRLRGGLQQAHDALHAAFLAYRQYRGFREAVAWSLVLPPDAPLPPRLQRYEAKASGYSLRQQVVMVGAALEHDFDRIVAAVVKSAPPLPQPVWSGAYDPYPSWNATFRELQQRMIERAGSTDAFLAQAENERRQLAAALVQAATGRIQQALAAPKAH